jgi:hypothetical protein
MSSLSRTQVDPREINIPVLAIQGLLRGGGYDKGEPEEVKATVIRSLS